MAMLPGLVGKPKFQTTGDFHFCVGNIQFPISGDNFQLWLESFFLP